jgi:hypothetical protein
MLVKKGSRLFPRVRSQWFPGEMAKAATVVTTLTFTAVSHPIVVCADNPWRLEITHSNASVAVTWNNSNAVLQSALTVKGVWSDLSSAASPYPVGVTNPASFFRLRLPCVAPPAGIVSWWTADGTAADLIGTNNGALISGVTYTNGEVAQAFSLDGSSGWVDVPDSASLNPTGPFSVECWVNGNPQQTSAQFLLVDKSRGWTDGTGWVLQGVSADGTVDFAYGIGGNNGDPSHFPYVSTTGSVLDNRWRHLAGVWTGTQLQIYLDGMLQGALDQTVLPVNNQRDVEIGRSWGGGSPTRFFHGLIDEVTYYSIALSAAQVRAVYNAGAAGKCKP